MTTPTLTHPNIAAYAAELLTELGPEWAAISDSTDRAVIAGPHPTLSAGVRVLVRPADTHGRRVILSGLYDHVSAAVTPPTRVGADAARITVSTSRAPATIVRDITTRLLPSVQHETTAAEERAARARAEAFRYAACADAIATAAASRLDVVRADDNTMRLRSRTGRAHAKVDTARGTFDARGLTAAQLEAITSALASTV